MIEVAAEPRTASFDIESSALLVIDMQRDFLEPGGFGEALGNDVSELAKCIEPCKQLLDTCRLSNLLVIHTREGHRADLSDVPLSKLERSAPGQRIGDTGPMGRILIRGEPGHALVEKFLPLDSEPVIDKPGKGAFYATDLEVLLGKAGIETLIICGVTTEVCVQSTVREANDRGYNVIVPGDCCGSYFPDFHEAALAMIVAQGGIFGRVSSAAAIIDALNKEQASA